jgi:hypothetical protein
VGFLSHRTDEVVRTARTHSISAGRVRTFPSFDRRVKGSTCFNGGLLLQCRPTASPVPKTSPVYVIARPPKPEILRRNSLLESVAPNQHAARQFHSARRSTSQVGQVLVSPGLPRLLDASLLDAIKKACFEGVPLQWTAVQSCGMLGWLGLAAIAPKCSANRTYAPSRAGRPCPTLGDGLPTYIRQSDAGFWQDRHSIPVFDNSANITDNIYV